jgi:hypothetical protein
MATAGQIIRASDMNRVVAYATLTANSSTTTTEMIVMTVGQASYQTGRAYRTTIKGLVNSSVANDTVTCRVRKTNISGQTVLNTFATKCITTAENWPVYFQGYFTPTTNFTDAFCATIDRRTGTGNILMAASATEHVAYLLIEDMGSGSLDSYPGIISV